MVTRTVTVTPTVGTPTAITVSAGVEPSCQLTNGTTSTTYATTATNSTGFNWSLSNNAAGSIGATTGIMIWADGFSGTVNIQVTANGCNGPSAQVTRTVTVNTLPTALVLTGSTICANPGGNGTITSSTSVTGVNYQLYNSANVTVQSAQPGTGSGLTWLSLAAGNGYYVIGTNGTTLCVSPNSNAVNVSTYPNTTPTITGSASVCINSTDTYTTQSGMNSYIWSVSGGSITSGGTSTDATVTITWTTQGAESVSVNYSRRQWLYCCCSLSIYSYRQCTANSDYYREEHCCPHSTNTYTTQTGMSDYVWTVSSGGTINGSATDNTVSITWNNSGSQSVSVNYTNPTTG